MVDSPDSAAQGQRNGVRGWRPAIGVAVSLVAIAGCVWWTLNQTAPDFPTSGRSLALLGASLAVYACSMLFRGYRWASILKQAGIQTARSEPYALTLVGYMGNTVLPLRGGEALRVVLLQERTGIGWSTAIGAIVPERLLDAATLIVLLGVVVLTSTIEAPGGEILVLVGAGLVVLAAVGVLLYYRLRRTGRLAGFADRVRPFAHASRPLLRPAGAWLALLTLVIWSLDGTVFWLVAQALDADVGVIQSFGLAVAATAFSTIPAGPAYAGTWDAALIVALEALDITGGAALTYVLLVRFVIFVPVTVAGLILVVTRYGGLGRLFGRRRAEAEQAAAATSGARA